MREELLEKQFTELLGLLKFDDEVLEWVRDALHASHADERCEHDEAIRRLQGEHRRLGDRINAMYVDKLDGFVDAAFFDKMSNQWREEQNRCQREIDWHQSAEQSYMDEGVPILELARNAQRLFERQEPRQKRRLLNFVLSNCTWEDGEVVATFRQPFDLLAETTAIEARHGAGNTGIARLRAARLFRACPTPKYMGVSNRSHGMRFALRRQAKPFDRSYGAGIDWLLFYNRRRLHTTPGYPGPMAFAEKRLANQQRLATSSISGGAP